MKKKLLLIICLLFAFVPVMSVHATGITVNPSNVSLVTGNSQTVMVTVTNLAALMDITSNNSSVAKIDKTHLDLTSNGPGSASGSFVITGVTAGSTTITIKTSDATDFTEGNDYNQTVTIRVTVTNPTTTTTTTTRPVTQQPTTRTTQAPVTEIQTTKPVEQVDVTESVTEPTTVPVIDNNSNGVDDEIEFSSLKVVGYKINFDPKVSSYTINVGEATALYINATALTEGATIDKTGEINIDGLDKVVLTLTFNGKTSAITLNIERTNYAANIKASPKTDEPVKFDIYNIISTVLVILLVFAFLFKEKIMLPFNKNAVATTDAVDTPVNNILSDNNISDPISFESNKENKN